MLNQETFMCYYVLMDKKGKIIFLLFLMVLAFTCTVVCTAIGSIHYTFVQTLKAIFVDDASSARLIIYNLRLPRILTGGLVGLCLALSGCILQAVMRNNLASPTTIGVTGGASFVAYLSLVVFPSLAAMLPIGAIVGALGTTLLIYGLSYNKGVNPTRMILSGLAISALFNAFNDMIKTFFADSFTNATAFIVGSLNSASWKTFNLILPYALIGIILCLIIPKKVNILCLGDEVAFSLGLRVETLRFILIIISSLLSGSAIAAAGIISFVGLIVPHFARLIVGSDHRFLFPASALMGYCLVIICDTIGRVIINPGEVSVSIILALLGAPFFLYLLRKKEVY